MKIGIDIDNTITDTLPLLKKYCEEYNSNVVKKNLKINVNLNVKCCTSHLN